MHFDTAEFDELLAQIAKDDATKAEAQKKLNQALIDKFSQLDSAEAERLEQSGKFINLFLICELSIIKLNFNESRRLNFSVST